MSILKAIGKFASKLIPFGGVVAEIISPDKTQAEKTEGLAMLDPIAQYNRTMARPRIALAITYTFILGTVIQWIQQLCKVPKEDLITMPEALLAAFTLAITFYMGSRGLEKIVSTVTGAIKKKRRKKK